MKRFVISDSIYRKRRERIEKLLPTLAGSVTAYTTLLDQKTIDQLLPLNGIDEKDSNFIFLDLSKEIKKTLLFNKLSQCEAGSRVYVILDCMLATPEEVFELLQFVQKNTESCNAEIKAIMVVCSDRDILEYVDLIKNEFRIQPYGDNATARYVYKRVILDTIIEFFLPQNCITRIVVRIMKKIRRFLIRVVR